MNEDLPEAVERNGATGRAIDRAVRTMMQVDPAPGLRRRVLARIEAPAPRIRLFPRVAAGIGALAVLVLAVVVFRPALEPASRPAEGAAIALPSPSAPAADRPAPREPVVEKARATASRQPRARAADTPIAMPRIANVFGGRDPRVSAAAAAIDDVVFPTESAGQPADDRPGMPPPIGVPEIRIAPLEVGRIRVEPMPTRK